MSATSQNYFFSSIGKKQVMAITGLGLCGFLVSHLLGNMLLLLGPDAFNTYAYTLTSTSLIYVAEIGLLVLFIAHVVLAITLTVKNKQARPTKYYLKRKTGAGETFASQTMIYTGFVLLVFIILHLINFKYGTMYATTVNGVEMRDLYRLVIEYFSNPLYVAWYVFAMIAIGIHTSHGFQSAFQSIGINHPKYTPIIKKISCAFGVIVGVGYSALAIFCYFQN